MKTDPEVGLVKSNVALVLRATGSLVRVKNPQDDVIRNLITTPYPIYVVLSYLAKEGQSLPRPIYPW